MSLLPSLRVHFNEAVSAEQRDAVVKKLRAIKGVISVGYEQGNSLASVTYQGGPGVVQRVSQDLAKTQGVTIDTRHRY